MGMAGNLAGIALLYPAGIAIDRIGSHKAVIIGALGSGLINGACYFLVARSSASPSHDTRESRAAPASSARGKFLAATVTGQFVTTSRPLCAPRPRQSGVRPARSRRCAADPDRSETIPGGPATPPAPVRRPAGGRSGNRSAGERGGAALPPCATGSSAARSIAEISPGSGSPPEPTGRHTTRCPRSARGPATGLPPASPRHNCGRCRRLDADNRAYPCAGYFFSASNATASQVPITTPSIPNRRNDLGV